MNEKKSEIKISVNEIQLDGILNIPEQALGIVLFAHGSGSSRLSTRNQHVADVLNQANLATLLFDLLTSDEDAVDEVTREHRFNIELLSSRLIAATDWVLTQREIATLPIGYFGASTGGAAALQAAAQREKNIKAVVSRGGRPDLAGDALPLVKSPTLLIVGGHDSEVIKMNESALAQMNCLVKLEIIPGATHLFEEPGALDQVSRLARMWFVDNLIKDIK